MNSLTKEEINTLLNGLEALNRTGISLQESTFLINLSHKLRQELDGETLDKTK
jgi:hypothetical protein